MKTELGKFNKSLGIDEIEEDLNKKQREVKKLLIFMAKSMRFQIYQN